MASQNHDRRNLLSKLTFKRVLNGLLIWASYHVSRISKKAIVWGRPISLSLEPTTACNLGCPECPSGLKQFTRPTGNLKTDRFEKFLAEIHRSALYLTFYFQGEPYINPDFLKMVKKASEKGLYTATSTNAHFLDDKKAKETVESGLDRLIVSIDGTTQDVYEQYRINGELSKVIEGTKRVIEWKKKLKSNTPHVIFQYLIVRPNEHQIADVEKLAHELGVDEVRYKTAQVYDYKNGNPLIPENTEYSRYKQLDDGTWAVKNKLINQCWRMWSSCVITWDGLVVPCCFDKDAEHRMGDLKRAKFSEIWKGAEYNGFRNNLLHGRDQIDICRNCSEGTKVWA